VLVALAALAAALFASPQAQAASAISTFGRYAPAPAYPEIARSSFYLTMRDGVRLAASVMRPARDGRPVEGRFPVLWQGSLALFASDRPGEDNPTAWSRLVRQGYVVVDVARRGNGASFGVQRGYHDRTEAYDAYEITEWLAVQPWSTGAVGVFGCSNTGEAAMHAFSIAPPHLKAVWAGCFSWSKYDGFLRGGGIVANWGAGPTRTLEQNMATPAVESDTDKALLRQAAEQHLKNTNLSELLQTLPFRDSWSPLTYSRFAYEGSVATYKPQLLQSKIPLYIQGGWNDDFRREGFVTLANIPGARLLIGPWGHCVSEGFDTVAEAQRFFDHHLKGIDTGIAADDPIHYFTVGAPAGQEWRSTKTWPLPGAPQVPAYLTAQGALAPTPASAGERAFQVSYDAGCSMGEGSRAQPCHPSRGAASFSQRMERAAEITGHVLIDLWITADAPDLNLFAYLEDVAPDGSVTVISDARQKASLRKVDEPPYAFLGLPFHRGWAEDARPLEPGKGERVQFDFLPASYVVKAGHRLQVTVAGADPRERFRETVTPAPTVRILTGGTQASRIVLPLARS
jgi:putative CocE/NonD family hydrolase